MFPTPEYIMVGLVRDRQQQVAHMFTDTPTRSRRVTHRRSHRALRRQRAPRVA